MWKERSHLWYLVSLSLQTDSIPASFGNTQNNNNLAEPSQSRAFWELFEGTQYWSCLLTVIEVNISNELKNRLSGMLVIPNLFAKFDFQHWIARKIFSSMYYLLECPCKSLFCLSHAKINVLWTANLDIEVKYNTVYTCTEVNTISLYTWKLQGHSSINLQ